MPFLVSNGEKQLSQRVIRETQVKTLDGLIRLQVSSQERLPLIQNMKINICSKFHVGSEPSAVPFGSSDLDACPGPGYRKFRGMFQFEARNHDELSFDVGDIVWVRKYKINLAFVTW